MLIMGYLVGFAQKPSDIGPSVDADNHGGSANSAVEPGLPGWRSNHWSHHLETIFFVKAFENVNNGLQFSLWNPSCATSCESTVLAMRSRLNKYLQINSVQITLVSQERLKIWRLLCGLEAKSPELWKVLEAEKSPSGPRGACVSWLVSRSDTQPTPGLPVVLRGGPAPVCFTSAGLARLCSRRTESATRAAQWTGQQCSHPRWRARSWRGRAACVAVSSSQHNRPLWRCRVLQREWC